MKNLNKNQKKGANLIEAKIYGADLESEDLTGANITSAPLIGADFKPSYMKTITHDELQRIPTTKM